MQYSSAFEIAKNYFLRYGKTMLLSSSGPGHMVLSHGTGVRFPVGASLQRVLAQQFFSNPTLNVTQELLGKFLVRKTEEEGEIAGMITEVEAYVGPEDKASHASRGITARTRVMFGSPGIWYVYMIYGMYHCLNIVTEPEGCPAAVLIRSIKIVGQPRILGIAPPSLKLRRTSHPNLPPSEEGRRRLLRIPSPFFQKGEGGGGGLQSSLIRGPGRVCRHFGIDKTFNEKPATKMTGLWIEDRGVVIRPESIQSGLRIGVDYAGDWKNKPWRFYLANI